MERTFERIKNRKEGKERNIDSMKEIGSRVK